MDERNENIFTLKVCFDNQEKKNEAFFALNVGV